MSEKNLEFWESVEKTNPNHTKAVTGGGRKLTAINAQQQMRNATEKWGMYGKTWGLKDIKVDYVNGLVNNQILAVAQAVFEYPDGSFEIGSSILVQTWYATKKYNAVDDDFLKKLETDMTTKALSKVGFNADVFLGYYDDNKYVAKMEQEFNKPKATPKAKYSEDLAKKAIKGKATLVQFKQSVEVSPEQEEAFNLLLIEYQKQ